jgi:hypothetical protein
VPAAIAAADAVSAAAAAVSAAAAAVSAAVSAAAATVAAPRRPQPGTSTHSGVTPLYAIDCEMCVSEKSEKELISVALVDEHGTVLLRVCPRAPSACVGWCPALVHAGVCAAVLLNRPPSRF